MRLADKTIIVTGSTTGIGEAMARRFVHEGARVLVTGRDRKRGEQVCRSLGHQAKLHLDDLNDPEAASRIVAAAIDAFGRIDVIVNNAAIVRRSNLATTSVPVFDEIIRVNLRAPLLIIQSACEHLKESRGVVLNIGSVNALCGETDLLAYSISKAGLATLSRNLGGAFGKDGIRVNCFMVGWVLTENEYQVKISDGLPPGWHQNPPREFVPSGRMTSPEDVAGAAVYWCSEESRPFSGNLVELEQYPMIGLNPAKG